MSKFYLPVSVIAQVKDRADDSCEYCLAPAIYALETRFHVDHIISLFHGGKNELDNLAWSCPICNNRKGTNLSTFLVESEEIVRLYHPRKDRRGTHFELKDNGEIVGVSNIGKGTIRLLNMNNPETVILRATLLKIGFL